MFISKNIYQYWYLNISHTDVKGTPFDFTADVHPLGQILKEAVFNIDGGGRPGVDHCFVVNGIV